MTIILLVVLALIIRLGFKGWRPATSALIFLVSSPLVIYLLGLLNSSNLTAGTDFVVRNASFLAFPLIFYFLGKWVNKLAVLHWFLIALSATNLYLLYLFVYYFNFGARFYKVVSVDIFHSTYLGLYNLVAFWICIHFYRLKKVNAYLGLAVFFAFCALLPSSRIIFILGLLSLLAALFVLVRSRKKLLGWSLIIILVGSGILISTPSIRQKFEQITEMDRFGFDPSNYKSVSSRFGKIQAATQVIRDHLLWGTGTGDLTDVLVEQYREMKFTMGYKYRYNPHNQYLDNLGRNGILGGSIALAALYLLPLWIGIQRKNLLVVSFSLLIAGVSLTESIMDVHKGITFYAFMVCFLLHDTLSGAQVGNKESRRGKEAEEGANPHPFPDNRDMWIQNPPGANGREIKSETQSCARLSPGEYAVCAPQLFHYFTNLPTMLLNRYKP
jgi:O-antigen ligase